LNSGWSFETRLASLGDVEFTNQQNLAYQVLDVTALRYWYHSRWSVFGRAGLARLFNLGSDANEVEINEYHVALGVGLGFAISPGWSLRGEQLSLIYEFGSPYRLGNLPMTNRAQPLHQTAGEPLARPAQQALPDPKVDTDGSLPPPLLAVNSAVLGESPTTLSPNGDSDAEVGTDTEAQDTVESEAAVLPPAEPRVAESEAEPTPSASNCKQALSYEPVAASGCPLFGGPLPDIQFLPGSNTLTEGAEETLAQVAIALESVPEANVTVIVHMAFSNDPDLARVVSRRRALTILRYLSDQGVDASRIKPEGRGVTEPLVNQPPRSRQNERVVLLLR